MDEVRSCGSEKVHGVLPVIFKGKSGIWARMVSLNSLRSCSACT